MKKLTTILGAILFALVMMTSCGNSPKNSDKPTSSDTTSASSDTSGNNSVDTSGNNSVDTLVNVVACADDCQKGCCLGCKATEGEASCSLLAAGDHSCCAVKVESTEEELEDAHEGHDHSDGGHSH